MVTNENSKQNLSCFTFARTTSTGLAAAMFLSMFSVNVEAARRQGGNQPAAPAAAQRSPQKATRPAPTGRTPGNPVPTGRTPATMATPDACPYITARLNPAAAEATWSATAPTRSP
jgi:hypothetical protein